MPNVIVNFSNVSVSVAVIFVGGWLLHDGYINDLEKLRNMGGLLILAGVCLYVALLEIYGK
jgi:hypothetical protein